jgi:uncharacterized protein
LLKRFGPAGIVVYCRHSNFDVAPDGAVGEVAEGPTHFGIYQTLGRAIHGDPRVWNTRWPIQPSNSGGAVWENNGLFRRRRPFAKIVPVGFEWDPVKAKNNLRKHGVSFEEAESVFYDLLAATVPDPDHSWDESRQVIVGLSRKDRLLIVSFVDRIDNCRIISARELTKSERSGHEQTK